MSISYTKPALTLDKQAELLLNRGLKDVSKETLEKKLASINYYRLRGYTYPYQNNSKDDTPFFENNSWNYIWNDYVMDSRLRSLIFESISHIEIALRTQIELIMSLSHGPTWYTDNRYFFNTVFFNKNLEELEKCWERSEEEFKKHYETKYIDTELPPSWMIFETSTFGLTSKYYESIDNKFSEKSEIAKYFGFSKSQVFIFVSWLKHLTTVRNVCAHHSRLYSRVNINRPVFPRRIAGNWVTSWPNDERVYTSICIIKKLLEKCAPEYDFLGKLKPIIKMARIEQLPSMGFPENWEEEPLFKEGAEQ